MPPRLAGVLGGFLLVLALVACTLTAPSDAELMGGNRPAGNNGDAGGDAADADSDGNGEGDAAKACSNEGEACGTCCMGLTCVKHRCQMD
jgi:hypothetical protein